jgi:lysyl-tRNA synthetase class 2
MLKAVVHGRLKARPEGRGGQEDGHHWGNQIRSTVFNNAAVNDHHRPEGDDVLGDGRRYRSIHQAFEASWRQSGVSGFVEAARQEKLQELVKRGVAPFAYRFERSGHAADALAAYRSDDDPAVHRLAGRLVALRPHGKTTFAHLADQSGKIQLYFKVDEFGAAEYELLSLLDLGDFVGIEGRLFKTRTGEITARVQKLTLLAKSLRPLPLGKEDESGVRHGGLADPEQRARQRYADLAVHPEVRALFALRSRVVRQIRAFLDARGYLEVETPVLQPLYGGAAARPFTTHYEALDATMYLRIADELYLKRCIVGGLEKVYEIGRLP